MTVHFAKVYSAQTIGLRANIINVETDITLGTLYAFSVVGLPDKAVEESRDRISAAIKHAGFVSPKNQGQKIVIALAPADIKKEGPSFDVPMALSYLSANGDIIFDPAKKLFLGELSLDGVVRPIKGVLLLVREAKRRGFTEVFVPKENAEEAALIEGIAVFGVDTLLALVNHLNERQKRNKNAPRVLLTAEPPTPFEATADDSIVDFADVRGQETAKRVLEIAAGGGHNVCMYGPPGTGKTMLARAFSAILPPLSFEEALEVTGIHSVAGSLRGAMISTPPFRAPHHTSSYTSLVGGGTFPRPGEITLAHRGVLFLDEFPEFETRVIEALRQPLEDRVINISRVKGSETFPARFLLIAAMNPCPCGNFGSGMPCTCTASLLAKYRRKISGPIIDRIDLWTQVNRVDHHSLAEKENKTGSVEIIRSRIASARKRQEKRFKDAPYSTNGEMSARDIANGIGLPPKTHKKLAEHADKLNLSARAHHKIIKIARTIADLDGLDTIEEKHVMEALSYRPRALA